MQTPPSISPPAFVDVWQRRVGDLAGQQAPFSGPGRVLKVKLGYNPNSSSVGSVVTVLMWTSTFGALALNVLAALVVREWQSARLALPGVGAADPVQGGGSHEPASESGPPASGEGA